MMPSKRLERFKEIGKNHIPNECIINNCPVCKEYFELLKEIHEDMNSLADFLRKRKK